MFTHKVEREQQLIGCVKSQIGPCAMERIRLGRASGVCDGSRADGKARE
jgi:hypothetical protein